MQLTRKQCNLLFTNLLIASIGSSLLQTALTAALPAIMHDLSITATTAQWLTSAYSLAMGIMVPATAFLMKRVPTRRLFLGASILFACGALVTLVTNDFSFLLFGRILQALGTGILLPMTQVVVLTIYPAEKRGSIMGIYGLAAGAAPVFAPTLAGIIIDVWNWRAIFLIVLVIISGNILFSLKVMRNVTKTERLEFDFLSMLLCTVGFSGVLIGLGNLNSAQWLSVAGPLAVGGGALAVFVVRQLRLERPFLELRTLRQKDFLLAVVISLLMYSVMMAGSTLFPIYIQNVMGKTATVSGLIMMPGSLVMALISPITGKIYDRFGIRKLAVSGSLLMFLSCLGVIFVNESTSVLYVSFVYILRLIAIGCIMMPVVTWGMSALDEEYTAHGTALLTSLRTISGAFGSAVFVVIMTYVTNISDPALTASAAGIDTAFLCMTVIAGIQLLVSVVWVGRYGKQ